MDLFGYTDTVDSILGSFNKIVTRLSNLGEALSSDINKIDEDMKDLNRKKDEKREELERAKEVILNLNRLVGSK